MTRTQAATLSAMLLLSGCNMFQDRSEFPNDECRKVAYDDPAVRQVRAEVAGRVAYNFSADENRPITTALRDAYLRCMRLRGLAPPGGVEPLRR